MRSLIQASFTSVVFDCGAKACEPRGADAERTAFQRVRFAQDGVPRSIVDGPLQPGQTTRHVSEEQVENFSNHVVTKCPELGQDAVVEDRNRGRL